MVLDIPESAQNMSFRGKLIGIYPCGDGSLDNPLVYFDVLDERGVQRGAYFFGQPLETVWEADCQGDQVEFSQSRKGGSLSQELNIRGNSLFLGAVSVPLEMACGYLEKYELLDSFK